MKGIMRGISNRSNANITVDKSIILHFMCQCVWNWNMMLHSVGRTMTKDV